jgi:phospholipid/cholesterol/gamma-HCH transport system substrate-binding protein
METRANYLLVGGFVLLLAAGLAAFVLWFAKLQFDVEFDRYDIRYAGTVTGLNEGSPVRYSGVRVGEVIVIQLDREDPSRVLVTIEVESATPVREDTEASLEIEGLTGTRYVLLSGGSVGSQPLRPEAGQKRAVIPFRPSTLERVLEGAPELLASANMLLVRGNALLSEENQANLSATLANLRDITGMLAERRETIGSLLDDAGETMTNLNNTAGSMNGLIVQLREDSRQLADRADRAVIAVETLVATLDTSVADTAADAQSLLAEMHGSAEAFTAMANEIQDLVAETRPPLRDFASGGLYELNTLLIEARALLAGLNRVTSEVERDPARFLFGDQQSGYETGQP